jgi:hypothetical protein
MTNPTSLSSKENTPLLTATPGQPVPRSGGLFRWVAGGLAFGGGAAAEGYFAAISFIAKSTAAGTAFGAGALLCAGGCAYCLYRVATTIRGRDIQQIQTTNAAMLSFINTKLNTILNKTEEDGPVNVIEPQQLHESIIEHLLELEHILPSFRTQIADLQGMLQTSMSTPASAFGSPGGSLDGASGTDASLAQLQEKLNALSQLLTKDQKSRKASRLASAVNSPAGTNTVSTPVPSPQCVGGHHLTLNSRDVPSSPYKGSSKNN